MKKTVFASMLLIVILFVAVIPVGAGTGTTGNGAPSGAHYNLNIIGVPKAKSPDMTGGDGHRIFVPLESSTKIYLSPGAFQVLDANGTDGKAAFQLPIPGDCYGVTDPLTGDVTTPTSCTVRYTVWIRALGKPNGKASMYTCVEDPDLAGGYLCSDPSWWVELTRTKGKSTFVNVSKQLLFLSADVDLDGTIEHVQLFDSLFDTYYWQYDNTGLKLAQLRFYMGSYTITW